ncbi:hypothetical protein [Anaerosporobacter sp.]|uniref:hypothetical protein n=1 Tax=Anaerosporobacter sp. TaxID=1872529 RepID=UPI00286F9AB4|nr:hypothetical protein [Anaerosporobacter sp.]
MGKNLNEIAEQLKNIEKKIQLIYAFNGTGKTRLSREFKALIAPKSDIDAEETGLGSKKILYYNAFTEDLFYWDNDLENDVDLKLKIHPNSFTEWVFKEQGQEYNVISNFQNYTNRALAPRFSHDYSEIAFSYKRGDDESIENIKISKGEESNFVWSVFYSLLEQVINVLNVPDPNDRETDKLNQLEYVFIDDPVTSLDDNHLIQMAVDLAQIIKKSESGLRFIITTHNPVFYNVMYNELGTKNGYMLCKNEDGSYDIDTRYGDSNKNFSYHQYLISVIKEAIDENKIEKYHFTLLRNLYEKAANFLGYKKWSDLLPDNKEIYASRIMNYYSHRTLLNEEIKEPTEPEKQMVKLLFNHLIDNSKFWKEV